MDAGRPTLVGRAADFPDGRGKVVEIDGVKVAVFKLGPDWYAIRDACPHMGASLGDGEVRDRQVTCFMHGWRFDLKTGAASEGRLCAKVREVELRGEEVWIHPEPPLDDDDDDDWVVFDPNRHLKKKD